MEWTITTNDTRKERLSRLRALLTERVLVVDGAMGTRIQQLGLTADDYGGPELEGCLEYLNVTRPDAIVGIHRSYLDAARTLSRRILLARRRSFLASTGRRTAQRSLAASARS